MDSAMHDAARVIEEAAHAAKAGDVARAIALVREALAARPGDADLLRTYARVSVLGGEGAGAARALRAIADAHVADAGVQRDAAEALVLAGAPDEALEVLARAAPADAGAAECRAKALLALGRVDEFRGAAAGIPEAAPDQPAAWWRGAKVLAQVGLAHEAAALLRRGLARLPDDPDLLEVLCYVMNFDPATDPVEHAALHRRLGEVTTALGPSVIAPFANARDPGRVLRVGFVSGDLRFHACAFFLAGLIAGLDRVRVQPVLYANHAPDETTHNFAALAPLRVVHALGDDDLEDVVRADLIDVLVDCNGWTGAHRLRALARRLAPVQVTYLGYPNTTGLAAMDARIVDAISDPPGAEAHASERLVRLAGCFVAFTPASETPDPAATGYATGDAGASAGPTFVCFNRVAKMHEALLALWARLVGEIPGARLCLKAEPEPGIEHVVRRAWARGGGAPGSLVLLPFEPDPRRHLAAYNQGDVALDTFPYNGTTSTFEALLMGVPVVTLCGGTHRARVGASILTHAGLGEFVAHSEAEYVALAGRVARDRAMLRDLRGTLRGRLIGGPLCDARSHAAEFERALRGLWTAWCGGRR
jgi:hypothetical protein